MHYCCNKLFSKNFYPEFKYGIWVNPTEVLIGIMMNHLCI